LASPAVKELGMLQRALYEKAYAEARTFAQGASPSLLSYSAKFEASLPDSFEPTHLKDILMAMHSAEYLLYGDFHTLKQSQRGLLRLLRAYLARYKKRGLVITMEMFKAKDQQHVDAYMSGRCSEQEFLDRVHYSRDWGFPWPNFKMILDFARDASIPVIGVNSPNAGRDALGFRDKFTAKRLAETHYLFPNRTIVCLIGEYHLADDHLPKALTQELAGHGIKARVARVLTNVDRYYFDLLQKPGDLPPEYLQLGKNFYCIMNSPPWMKWQSYAIWEEMRSIGGNDLDDEDADADADLEPYTEEAFDFDYQFFGLVKNLAHFLGVKARDAQLSKFHIFTSAEADFYNELREDGSLPKAEISRIIERTTLDGVYFISESSTVLLADVSINNMADAAGQFLHHVLTGFDDVCSNQAEEFYRKVIKSAVGMLGSKILNPRRKSPDLKQWQGFLEQNNRRRLIGHAKLKRNTARAILRHHAWIEERLKDPERRFRHPPSSIFAFNKTAGYEVSRAIGHMLAFQLYGRVMNNQVPTEFVRNIFRQPLITPADVWRQILDLYDATS